MANLLAVGAPAHVQEVGRRAAGILDNVHRRHGQPGAVHQAGDVPVQLDVVQAVLGGLDFQRVFFVDVAQLFQVFVAEERVIFEVVLGVGRKKAAVGGGD